MDAHRIMKTFTAALLLATTLMISPLLLAAETTLLNVSYDPTRELYDDYNKAFAQYWKQKTGKNVSVRQSHGGDLAANSDEAVAPPTTA